jgi:hypothetical protein
MIHTFRSIGNPVAMAQHLIPDELLRQLSELEQRQAANLRVPKYASRVLTKQFVSQHALTNWLTRKVFHLDADEHRDHNSTRLFSCRDAVLLACAAHFVMPGLIPLSIAKPVAEHCAASVLRSLCQPKNSISTSQEVMVFPLRGRWLMAQRDGQGQIIAKDLASDDADGFELSAADLPAARFVFEPERLVLGILEALGEGVVIGNATQIRRAAATKQKRRKGS